MANKTRLRFNTSDDLNLLKAVIADNPFVDTSRWNAVQKAVVEATNKPFTVRTVKDHLELLLKLYQQNDATNLRKSSTDIVYIEKLQLLQEICDLKNGLIKTFIQLPSTSQYEEVKVKEEEETSCTDQETPNKTRLRFTTSDDMDLLKAVIADNPFEDSSRWNAIQEAVIQTTNKPFTIRALKEHLQLLLKSFQQNGRTNLKKSATEEEYLEKEQLLQEVYDLKIGFSKVDIQLPATSKCEDLKLEEERTLCTDEVSYILQADGRLVKETQNFTIDSTENQLLTESSSTASSLSTLVSGEYETIAELVDPIASSPGLNRVTYVPQVPLDGKEEIHSNENINNSLISEKDGRYVKRKNKILKLGDKKLELMAMKKEVYKKKLEILEIIKQKEEADLKIKLLELQEKQKAYNK